MTDDQCPREPEVVRASESGEWPPDLPAHLDACSVCREVEAVTRVLRAAVEGEPATAGPSAEAIWWRAQLEARVQARATAMRPLDTLEGAEPLVVLVAVATLLVVRGDALAAGVLAWVTSDATGQLLQAVMPPALMPVLMLSALVGGLVLLVGIGAVIAND